MELAEWKVSEITFNQLGGRDRPEFYPDNRLTERQADELPELINKIRGSLSKTKTKLISSEGYLRRIQASAHDRLLPIIDCQAGNYYLFVNAKGKVAPCSFTIEEYGRDISSILNTEDFESLPYSFQTGKRNSQALACKDCPCTNVHGKFS
jgi:radical SAM protein with 4Fe4S-binding SPASM domain